MAALTKERDTQSKTVLHVHNYKVKAAAKIFAGALVAVDATGYLIPASDTAALFVIGRAQASADNTSGANGALSVDVAAGVFKYATSGGSALVQADVGHTVFVLDDQTLVKTGGTANTIVAGVMTELDADGGVWVDTYRKTA